MQTLWLGRQTYIPFENIQDIVEYSHTWTAAISATRRNDGPRDAPLSSPRSVVVLTDGRAYECARKADRLQQEWRAWRMEGATQAETQAWGQRYATVEDAAAETGYAAAHLRWLLKLGLVKGYKRSRRWVVERESLWEYMYKPAKGGTRGPQRPTDREARSA